MERKTYSRDEIDEKLGALPENVRNFVYSDEIDAVVQKIGQKNQLHIDQMGLLQAEVTDVMIGTTEPNDFVPYMMETLQIDQAKAEAIAKDTNEMLFEKIRQAMRDGTPLTSETSSPAQPTVAPVASVPVPPAPKREFPAADVMLTQKTVTPPASAFDAMSVHEAAVVVPPKLVPMTTMPPATQKAPSTFVTTPAQPISHTVPPITTLPPKIPSGLVSSTPTAPIPPPQSPIVPPSVLEVPTPPTPSAVPAQNPYKTDPYREPIE